MNENYILVIPFDLTTRPNIYQKRPVHWKLPNLWWNGIQDHLSKEVYTNGQNGPRKLWYILIPIKLWWYTAMYILFKKTKNNLLLVKFHQKWMLTYKLFCRRILHPSAHNPQYNHSNICQEDWHRSSSPDVYIFLYHHIHLYLK